MNFQLPASISTHTNEVTTVCTAFVRRFFVWPMALSIFTQGASLANADESSDIPVNSKGAFVSECAFANGAKAMLVYALNSDRFYVLVRDGRDIDDLSTVVAESSTKLSIETNGGLAKQIAVDKLFRALLKRKFSYVFESEFEKAISGRPASRCSMTYPF